MELEQFGDCQEVVHWCAGNALRMQTEGDTPEEIIRACLDEITPQYIHPDVVARTAQAFLS